MTLTLLGLKVRVIVQNKKLDVGWCILTDGCNSMFLISRHQLHASMARRAVWPKIAPTVMLSEAPAVKIDLIHFSWIKMLYQKTKKLSCYCKILNHNYSSDLC